MKTAALRNASVDVSYRRQGTTDWKQALPMLRLQGERAAELFYDGTEKSRTVARGVNDFIAKMMVDHARRRFGLFAAIPLPGIFGTDYPLEPIESTHNEMAKLRLPSDLRRAVDRTNAERLIPRLARAQ